MTLTDRARSRTAGSSRGIGSAASRFGTLLWIVVLLVLAPGTSQAVARHLLVLDIRDASDVRIDARASVLADSFGTYAPAAADTTLMAHAGYCYPTPTAPISSPHGWTTVNVSRGPEWFPDKRRLFLGRDTTVVVKLNRFYDMRARGFYSSDLHVHSRHDPIEFTVSPVQTRRIARAEDLGILHLLDQEYRFIGSPDPLSDANTILYHSYEYRHMTYGHVVLPGLREAVSWGCCLAPAEAWPLLEDLDRQVAAPGRALFVLAHPGTTDDFNADTAWPGTGLGREYAVLAVLGRLDGFEVASYSNEPYERWSDWFDALSSGLALTPTAGTDAVLNIFARGPAGGWRVYADLGPGTSLGYNPWIEAVRAGRTFVTSLPLIPRFRVANRGPGEALEAPGDTLQTTITLETACATGLTKVSIVSDRGTLWSMDLTRRLPASTRWDSTFVLRTPTPVWMALRVDGVSSDRSLLGNPAVAHTNAVRLLKNNLPRCNSKACGRMLDRVDQLEILLNARRGWTTPWHQDSVFANIRRARTWYGRAFTQRPSPFQLVAIPPAGTTRIRWSTATDAELGDKVRYRVTVAADSLFKQPATYFTDLPWVESTPIRPSLPCWWRVEAVDRGGNVTACNPPTFKATLLVASAGVDDGPGEPRPRTWPNPARGPVRLEGLGSDALILDVAGRRIATLGNGLRRDGTRLVWDARVEGRRARPGLYWAISRRRGVSLPITILD